MFVCITYRCNIYVNKAQRIGRNRTILEASLYILPLLIQYQSQVGCGKLKYVIYIILRATARKIHFKIVTNNGIKVIQLKSLLNSKTAKDQ